MRAHNLSRSALHRMDVTQTGSVPCVSMQSSSNEDYIGPVMADLKRPEMSGEALANSAQAISKIAADVVGQFWDRTQSVAGLLLDVNADGIKFIEQRIAQTNEMLGHLAGCRGLPEFLEAESQWFQGELDAYSEYVRRLADFNIKLIGCVSRAQDGAEPTQPQAAIPSKSKQISKPAMQA